MDDISVNLQDNGTSPEEQERLLVLTYGFKKLEDSQKDYIRELTRKLADIHCGGGHREYGFRKALSPFQI